MTKTCVVTGAASGIGAATLAKLRELGWQAIGWDIAAPADDPDLIRVDVSDEASVVTAWTQSVQRGPVSGLVNAAGIFAVQPIAEVRLSDWQRMIGINLTALFLTCRAAIPHMAEHGGGAIVNIASIAALQAPKTPCAAYAAAKGGVVSFSRALASEVGKHRIRVNSIAPGAIETPLLTSGTTPEQLAVYASRSSLGTLGKPGQVGDLIAYLLSEAASLVHGACIEVPGS